MARACHAAGMQGALRPYCEAMFQAVFVSNEDIDEQTCAAIASRIKLDERLFSQAIGSNAANEKVTANVLRAFDRGAFGVPTFCRRYDVLGQRSSRPAGALPRPSGSSLSQNYRLFGVEVGLPGRPNQAVVIWAAAEYGA
jgi:hypothetical protein